MADLPLKAKELMRNIHKRVFMTYLRMATNKESKVRIPCSRIFSPFSPPACSHGQNFYHANVCPVSINDYIHVESMTEEVGHDFCGMCI